MAPGKVAKRREHYEANRLEILDAARLYAYGISRERYDQMLEEQGGVCAVCKEVETSLNRRGEIRAFCVDHDHACCPGGRKTCGKCVRGLICTFCNRGIGYFRDDPERLTNAAEYLLRYKQTPSTMGV